jgi:hypothetical protein
MLDISIRKSFFDRRAVTHAMSRARVRALSRAGAFIRTRARSLLRRRRKPSAPGSPPSVHAGSGDLASLKTILFAWDPRSDAVVVGPIKLNIVTDTAQNVRTTIPGLHERGETASLFEKRFVPTVGQPSPWRRVDRRRQSRPDDARGKTEFRRRTAKYPARPFMRPAFDKELPKMSSLFANSIKR